MQVIGTPYKRFRGDERFDAIVIGSGIGGLGTAALLAKSGHRRVLVLEQHYTGGGLTHVFRRPGFEWDVGLHYVGQVHDPDSPARRLFDYLTEGRLVWAAMPNAYATSFAMRSPDRFPASAAPSTATSLPSRDASDDCRSSSSRRRCPPYRLA
jgi:all-trans-retinol 13,14-reductase